MANTLIRSMHDVGLAAWFGGTLANAVALNPAARETSRHSDAGAVVNTGWDRWTPVNAAAIGVHLVGSTGLLFANKGRVAGQKGVGAMTLVKTGVTAAALGATAYARILGSKVSAHHDVPVSDGTTPAPATPPEVASAQQQLAALQWVIPALTGGLVVLASLAGEQQRAASVIGGVVHRIIG
jgi:hypothetical protein